MARPMLRLCGMSAVVPILGVALALGCYDPSYSEPELDGPAPPPPREASDGAAGTSPDGCLTPYVVQATGCYRIVQVARSWPTAQADCEDDVPGATHLVVFESSDEHDLVEALGGSGWDFWIGLVDDGAGWRWVTGDAPTFSRWEGDEMEGWTCGRIVNGDWDDEECPKDQRYACELDGRPAVVAPAP